MPARNWHYDIHIAADSCVMNQKNSLRAIGDALLDLGLIDVKGVPPNVDKDRLRTAEDKRIECRWKRECRDNHFIVPFEIQKQRSHFQGMCARRCEKRLLNAKRTLEKT